MFYRRVLELVMVEPINLLKEDYNDLTWDLIKEALCVKIADQKRRRELKNGLMEPVQAFTPTFVPRGIKNHW
jgi:hypothetical protein